MTDIKGRIHSIESFGTVDGPGVRFVVFMQGCPMRCLYCHNPDTWVFDGGKEISASQVIQKMLRNIEFYETGGITVSGGEPLAQMEFVTELFKLAKEHNIHTTIDTSGITFNKNNTKGIDTLLEYCDLVMLDIKSLDKDQHLYLTGFDNKNPLELLNYLEERKKPVWIRHVIVPDITYNERSLKALGAFLKSYSCVERIEVLPYHSLGQVKYERLGIDYPLKDTPQLTKADAKRALDIINQVKNG